MARGVNKVIIVGNLGADPQIKYMPSGDAVANISVATSESWKDKQTNEQQERTEWHRITFYKRLAEVVGEYLRKGSQIYVEGRLRTRSWEKEGQTHYSTEIIGDSMQMLGSRNSGSTERTEPRQATGGGGEHKPESDFDDDIPFITRDGIK